MERQKVCEIVVNGISVTVVRKKIRSMNIYVKPPDGQVRVSVPTRTSDRMVQQFVLSHLGWIERQRVNVIVRHPVYHYVTGEIYPVFGVPHTLILQDGKTKRTCGVYKEDNAVIMTALPGSTVEERKVLFQKWQRRQLHDVVSIMMHRWANAIGVEVREWHIKRMKTKWGTCNYRAHRIWLSLALAEQPIACVEYVVVHELCHLLEPRHNARFWEYMTQYLPDWGERRKRLNTL
ncbi:MAG: SprT family zinc-dependent metalloprotease [Eubacteriales bacterium]|nr:SprT family zinc-dependent metalloprotease [Eubacteriales bacterium]